MSPKMISLTLAGSALSVIGFGAAIASAECTVAQPCSATNSTTSNVQYSSCTNSYGPGAPAPQGYGSAYDFVTNALAVSVDCNANAVTVGTGNTSEYVYKLGYVYQNGAWQQLSLARPGASLISDNWYTGSAQASLGSADLTQSTYVVGYVCDYAGNAWKCGCANEACATSAWQLQAVQGTRAQNTTTGNSTGTTQSGTYNITWTDVESMATINVSVGTTLNAAYSQSSPGHYGAMINYQGSDNTSVVSGEPVAIGTDATMNAVGQGTAHLKFMYSTGCATNIACPQASPHSTVTVNVQ